MKLFIKNAKIDFSKYCQSRLVYWSNDCYAIRNCSVPSQWLLNSYEKTIKLGQTDKDGTLYDVTTITLYDGSYMGIKIYGLDDLDMIFAVSEDTANYLNRYFE